jgi:hypothetical protein
MKSNVAICMALPFDTNPLTRMWCFVTTSWVFVYDFPEYVKLAEMAMVQIVWKMKTVFLHWLSWNQSFVTSLLPICLALGCLDVCTTVLHFAKFPICKVYWTMASSMTLLLLWWLGWVVFCGVVGHVFANAGVVTYISTKADSFWPMYAFLFVEFNGCFISQQTFWTPIKLVSLLVWFLLVLLTY